MNFCLNKFLPPSLNILLRNLIISSILSVASLGFKATITYASTTVDYKSPCKYFASNGELKVSTICTVNFGTLGVSGGARFIVTFPNNSQVVIYDYVNGKAETNDIPSDVSVAGGNVIVATDEGEIFIFKTYY